MFCNSHMWVMFYIILREEASKNNWTMSDSSGVYMML